ncbi:hypothetical protein CEXT_279621 [Caerostris extrusa]|uniref:Uncharacterized protein n=1 Tax=Caerostris extrusa TaxID=172846 RepID=A0AAV4X2K9_CAEEX|nr:hypothetical protein CEXT_279621 [Caerostris extrusa]
MHTKQWIARFLCRVVVELEKKGDFERPLKRGKDLFFALPHLSQNEEASFPLLLMFLLGLAKVKSSRQSGK